MKQRSKTRLVVSLAIVVATVASICSAEPTQYVIVVTGSELLSGIYPDGHTYFITQTLRPLPS